MSYVLYLTRNGLLEPLGQSQIWPYLRSLSCDHRITIISFEKLVDHSDPASMKWMHDQCSRYGIHWIPLKFRSNPRPLAPACAIFQLFIVAALQWRHRQFPQIVHARSYVPAAIALVLHRFTGVPFIFDMRALWPEELITAGNLRRGSLLHIVLLRLERRCLQKANAVVSLTQAAVSHLKNQYPRQLARQNLLVIPTCADLQRFQPSYLSPSAPFVFSCIGTVLSGWFLIHWLRAFFEAIASVDSTARFEIISRDNPAAIISVLKPGSAWCERLAIEAATPAQIPSILHRHTASAMFFSNGLSKLGSSPTRMAELLGCGKPVVVNSGVGDVADIVCDRRIGIVARGFQADAMNACVDELFSLLSDPELNARCRLAAEDLFSLETGASKYGEVYASIAK
jgi:glycosyltransferase involved in cell wall biosynthesis